MLLTLLNPFAAGGDVIDGAAAKDLVKSDGAVLLDVREAQEIQGGRAQGAVHVPLSALASRANPSSPQCEPALAKGKPVIIYCASGARSGMAAKMLKKLGHEKVYNLGSLSAWMNAGGKLTR
jgi:rhodanese-related sulfurtransferase